MDPLVPVLGMNAQPAQPPSVRQQIIDKWRQAGASDHAIAGVLANVHSESNFNPSLRVADQPHFGGEAHYAHGLYQEGGDEWNNYANWLKGYHPGASWQDPALQSEFAATNLRDNPQYKHVWNAMNNAQSPGEAAQQYVRGYLKPAPGPMAQRVAQYGKGVPGLNEQEAGQPGPTPPASPAPTPALNPDAVASPEIQQAQAAAQPQPQQTAESVTAPGNVGADVPPVAPTPPPAQPTGLLSGKWAPTSTPTPDAPQPNLLSGLQIPYYARHTNQQIAMQKLQQQLPQGFSGVQGV